LDMLFRWEAGSIGWNLLNSDKSYIQWYMCYIQLQTGNTSFCKTGQCPIV
jgi:hypothetical protein